MTPEQRTALNLREQLRSERAVVGSRLDGSTAALQKIIAEYPGLADLPRSEIIKLVDTTKEDKRREKQIA